MSESVCDALKRLIEATAGSAMTDCLERARPIDDAPMWTGRLDGQVVCWKTRFFIPGALWPARRGATTGEVRMELRLLTTHRCRRHRREPVASPPGSRRRRRRRRASSSAAGAATARPCGALARAVRLRRQAARRGRDRARRRPRSGPPPRDGAVLGLGPRRRGQALPWGSSFTSALLLSRAALLLKSAAPPRRAAPPPRPPALRPRRPGAVSMRRAGRAAAGCASFLLALVRAAPRRHAAGCFSTRLLSFRSKAASKPPSGRFGLRNPGGSEARAAA